MADIYPLDQLTYDEQVIATGLVFKWFQDRNITLNIPTEENPEGNDVVDLVILDEPPKKEQLAYTQDNGPKPARRAIYTLWQAKDDIYNKFIIEYAKLGGEIVEPRIIKHKVIENARPSYCCADDDNCSRLIIGSLEFREILKRRFYLLPDGSKHFLTDEDIDTKIYLDISVDGRLDNCKKCYDCEGPAAILKVPPRPHSFYCTPFWNDGISASTAAYIQPIPGVFVFIDRRTNKILEIVNDEAQAVIPIQTGNLDWKRDYPNTLKPLLTSMPCGPSYNLDGYSITWGNWSMRFGIRQDTGFVLYEIKYLDHTYTKEVNEGIWRSICYRANLGEFITGYANPNIPARNRNYLDIRDYPAREFMVPLILGVDVPDYADLMPGIFTGYDGGVYSVDDVLGIYESDELMLGGHFNYPCGYDAFYEGYNGRLLNFYTKLSVGNYDYSLNWQFDLVGRFKFICHATGCLETDATPVKNNGEEVENGTLVNTYVNGINHYHRFCIRADMDVDGTDNSVYEGSIVQDKFSERNPCGNALTEKEKLLETELSAVRDTNGDEGRFWIVANENSKNKLGYPRAYAIKVPSSIRSIVHDCERIAKRAEFTKHDFFATKYHDGEIQVMGNYPVEAGKDQGIHKYIENDENIVDTDSVQWIAAEFVHGPSSENYPFMAYEEVVIKFDPDNFFDENPILTNGGYIRDPPLEVQPQNGVRVNGPTGSKSVRKLRMGGGCVGCKKK